MRSTNKHTAHITALKAAIIYLTVAMMWMLFTEQLVLAFVDVAVRLSRAQLIKRFVFMLMTAGLIYWLVYRIVWTMGEARSSIQSSQQRYQLLADNAGDIIWTSDLTGKLTYISPSVQRLLGFSPRELHELSGELILSKDSRGRLVGALQELTLQASTGERSPLRVELEMIQRSQERRWFEAELSLLCSPGGEVEGVLGVGRDIQLRREIEAQQRRTREHLAEAQKMEAIGTLAGGIAHDINNLLVVMLGNTELARLKVQNLELHRYLDSLQGAAERASELVKQVLLFSRRQPSAAVPLDLNQTVLGMLQMLDRLMGEQIVVEVQLAEDLHWISADNSQLEQVMINLAVNARDAMPTGGQLRISTENIAIDEEDSLPPGQYVRLKVSDTGEGIPLESLPRIFEPFYTTKPPGQGTGLGLSTAYGIVQEHEGTIRVSSIPAAGTTFSLMLPALSLDEPPAAPSPDHAPFVALAPAPPSRPLLLVEDEEGVRAFIEQALAVYGYEVVTARDLAQARAIIAEEDADFSMLISDVILPDGSGPELVRELRLSHPKLPALLISGHPGDRIETYFRGEAPPLLLRKPFSLAQLFAALDEIAEAEDIERP